MAADSLLYAFRYLWGGDALEVNGRFHEVYPDGRLALLDYLRVSHHRDARPSA